MKGWVGLVGWPIADGLPTSVVTHRLQVERRTVKSAGEKTDVIPLFHATNELTNWSCVHDDDNKEAQRQCLPSSAHAFHFQQVRKVSVAVLKLLYTKLVWLNLGRKPTICGPKTETCFWCSSICQWSTALWRRVLLPPRQRIIVSADQFLPRDAMLARYMLWCCVRLSIRLSVCRFWLPSFLVYPLNQNSWLYFVINNHGWNTSDHSWHMSLFWCPICRPPRHGGWICLQETEETQMSQRKCAFFFYWHSWAGF